MKRLILILTIPVFVACTPKDKSEIVVAIQPFENFDQALADTILQSVEEVYGFTVIQLETIEIPDPFFINVKSPRFRADSLIQFLGRNKPDSIDYVLGLTAKDISTTKRDMFGNVREPASKYQDWGVFGLGFRPGPSSMVSTFRIKSANEDKYIERLKKICMHELGHNLGLKHCEDDEKCVMRDAAETIKTVDHVELSLCTYCASKIR